ncbi:MAG: hypothetical protein GY953_24435, partial [bacterium]|nr:hypothetical protein [bacterium]
MVAFLATAPLLTLLYCLASYQRSVHRMAEAHCAEDPRATQFDSLSLEALMVPGYVGILSWGLLIVVAVLSSLQWILSGGYAAMAYLLPFVIVGKLLPPLPIQAHVTKAAAGELAKRLDSLLPERGPATQALL